MPKKKKNMQKTAEMLQSRKFFQFILDYSYNLQLLILVLKIEDLRALYNKL